MAYEYSRVDWDGLCDHLRDVTWEDIFKLSASAAASEFCEWVEVGIDVYIPHCKYQVKPLIHLHGFQLLVQLPGSPLKSLFSFLYQQNKSSESKVKFKFSY